MAKKLLFSLLLLSVAAYQFAWADEDADASAEGVEDDEYADQDRAHLVIRKHLKNVITNAGQPNLVVQGRNVTVVVDIFNAGTGAAYEVNIRDTQPVNSTLVDGSVSFTVGKIVAGSSVQHSYVVQFNNGNAFATLPLAIVSYKPEADAAASTDSYSTEYSYFVMTPVQQIQRYALKVGAYASLGFAKSAADWRNMAILFAVVGSLVGFNFFSKQYKAATVSRNREKALKELEKSD